MDYKSQYFKLFAAAANAVDALDRHDPTLARTILIQAQQAAEEAYISADQPVCETFSNP